MPLIELSYDTHISSGLVFLPIYRQLISRPLGYQQYLLNSSAIVPVICSVANMQFRLSNSQRYLVNANNDTNQ